VDKVNSTKCLSVGIDSHIEDVYEDIDIAQTTQPIIDETIVSLPLSNKISEPEPFVEEMLESGDKEIPAAQEVLVPAPVEEKKEEPPKKWLGGMGKGLIAGMLRA